MRVDTRFAAQGPASVASGRRTNGAALLPRRPRRRPPPRLARRGATSLGGHRAVLALQGESETPSERRRRSAKRGHDLLDGARPPEGRAPLRPGADPRAAGHRRPPSRAATQRRPAPRRGSSPISSCGRRWSSPSSDARRRLSAPRGSDVDGLAAIPDKAPRLRPGGATGASPSRRPPAPMLFNSFVFLLAFLPAALLLHAAGRALAPQWRLPVLVAPVLRLLRLVGLRFVPLLAGSILVNWLVAARLPAGRRRRPDPARDRR